MAEDVPDTPPGGGVMSEGEPAEDSGPTLSTLEAAFDDLVSGDGGVNEDDADADVKSDTDGATQLLEIEASIQAVPPSVEGGRIPIDDDDIFSSIISPESRRGSDFSADDNSPSTVEDASERETAEDAKEEALEDTSDERSDDKEAVLEKTTSDKKSDDQQESEAMENEQESSGTQPISEMTVILAESASAEDTSKIDDKNKDDDDEEGDDEDVRKAMAMVELMRSHPHLSPEEMSRRASELVGDSRQKKLVEAKMPPKPKSILEEALNSKQGQGLMAALKETGILQSVPSMDGGISGGASSSGGGATSSAQVPGGAGAHNVNVNVLAGFKNVQESIRQQQSKVTKNLKDFGLIKEQDRHSAAAATESGPDADGVTTPRTSVASPTSPGSLVAIGSTDFGCGSPDTKSRTMVVAAKDGSRAVTPKVSHGGGANKSDMAAVSAPAATGGGDGGGELSDVNSNTGAPTMPDLGAKHIGKDTTKVTAASTSPMRAQSSQPHTPSRIAASAPSQPLQSPGVPAMPKLFAGKGEIQGFPLDAPGATLSSMLWKRRSGLGKLQKNAWERRRMVLRDGIICYFKGDGEARSAALSRQASLEDVSVGNDAVTAPSTGSDNDSSGRRQTWWEQATSNIQKQAAEITQQVATSIAEGQLPGYQPADPNAPRGVIDIRKERATFAATAGHSGAPSPFCVSMKVKGETKWKVAFETRSEQMKWLAALTDVVVKTCTDEYNEGLKMTESTSSVGEKKGSGEPMAQRGGQAPSDSALAQQPSLANLNVGGFLPAATAATLFFPPPNKTEKFWKMDEYAINSGSGTDETDDDESEGSSDDDDVERKPRTSSEKEDAVDAIFCVISTHMPFLRPSTRIGDKWMLQGDFLYYSIALLNMAILYARRSSTSISQFWFFTFAVNVIVWVCIQKRDDDAVFMSMVGGEAAKEEKATRKKLRKQKKAKKALSLEIIKPRAGSTSMRVEKAEDKPKNNEGHQFCGYRALPSTEFQVRSHGYLSTKKKIPCPGDLYTLVAMDVFESGKQYRDMGKRVKLPPVAFKDSGEKTWNSPDIFVVSVALPTEAPKLGRPEEDGQGFTITMYFTMKQSTRNVLRRVTAPGYDASQDTSEANKDVQKRLVNGVRLWEEWCRRAPEDPSFQARFKFIPFGSNLAEIGMPGWIGKYNGKPVLIKRAGVTGFLFDHPELNAMGFDISLHPFPYLAKQATAYMAETYFKQMVASFAFVIEGRNDDELPEVLIGQGSQICYPDPALAIKADDWFTGQSPISDEVPTPILIEEQGESTETAKWKDEVGQDPSLGVKDKASFEDTVRI